VIEGEPLRHNGIDLSSIRDCALDVGDAGALAVVGKATTGVTPMTFSHEAFRDLYQAHFNFVWCALRRLGVREDDALDLTQMVFVTAYRKLSGFEGRSQLRTWLFGICRRTASAYRRSARVHWEVATDATAMDAYPEPDHGSRTHSGARERAEGLLNSLPEAQRIVFVLFELDGMSGPEIAELLGISLGTVRSRLRLARALFERRALKGGE
jgi:RNA polymerase sigma-70 factor (ECF subfamily)